ncbi:MAG: hypothetical protein RL748_3106 [Pseudomonadota bacterium]|jgi:hypothetical protein
MKFRFNQHDDILSTSLFALNGDFAPAMFLPRAEVVSAPLFGTGINHFGNLHGFASNDFPGLEPFALTGLATVAPPVPPSTPNLLASSDSGRSSTDNITKIVTPSFSGTAAAGNLIYLYDGEAFVGKAIANSKGAWSITSSALGEGVHLLSATATDSLNNVSLPSATLSVTIDTKAPVAPGIPNLNASSDSGSSNTDNITSVSTPTFSGTTEARARIDLFDSTTNALLGSTVANSKGVWSISSSTLMDGKHAVNAVATDVAGNSSAFSAPLVVTIDTSAPAAPMVDLLASADSGIANSDNITNVTTPIFSGITEAGATVSLYADGIASPVATAVANSKGEWLATTKLAEGLHSLTAKATDLAGNVSAISAPLQVTIDTSAPLAPGAPDLLDASDNGSSNTDNVTSVLTPAFSGKAEAGATVSLLDDVSHLVLGKGIANSLGVWNITSSTLAQGKYSLSTTAMDLAGNISAASTPLIVTIETIAPAAPSTPDLIALSDSGRSNSDNLTNAAMPTFSGTAQAGVTVTLYDGSGNTNVVGKAIASNSGAWSISGKLGEGAHALHATATDPMNHVSSNSGDLIVTIDTTAPRVSINVPPLTNDNTPTLSGTAEVGGGEIQLWNAQNKTVFANTSVDSLGNWSYTLPTTADGTYSVYATQSDAAGNEGSSIIRTGTIDTTAPAVTLNIPARTNDSTPTITGTGEFGGGVIQLWNAQNNTSFASATVDASGRWNYTMPTTPDGTYTIYATQNDQAGNRGVSTPHTGTIDTTPPNIVIDSFTTNDNTPLLTGRGEYSHGMLEIFYEDASHQYVSLGATLVAPNGTWQYQVQITVPNGTYHLKAEQTDDAVNHGIGYGTVSVVAGLAGVSTASPELFQLG